METTLSSFSGDFSPNDGYLVQLLSFLGKTERFQAALT
uniref:Uncharacterized protein n=1 Tax=mine drainage metagenome TaxID=410659 RepID=E6PPY8_9ZZZZ